MGELALVQEDDVSSYHWKDEDLEKVCEEYRNKDPRQFGCGYLGTDGVGEKMFFWASSWPELLALICYLEPLVHFSEDEQELARLRGELTDLFTGMVDQPDSDLMDKINATLPNHHAITWIGDFEDLISMEGEFETELSGDFLDNSDYMSFSSEGAMDDFIEFLRGIS